MRKQIDHFLLGLLWLLAVALGASFWFNTKFGFNIFSGPHWEYLGQMQAARVPINTWFYISMIVAVFIMIFGLYLLVRPRFRKMHLPQLIITAAKEDSSEIMILPGEPAVKEVPVQTHMVRPPKLNISQIKTYQSEPADISVITPTEQNINVVVPKDNTLPDKSFEELNEIFKSAGYLVKTPPRLGKFRPALFAIGADESLWIGGISIEMSGLSAAAEQLRSIFTDTLQDIEIHINLFIITPKADDSADGIKIDTFNSISDLREFMTDHKNPELDGTEKENFDAYSEYIDTVINYLK